MRTRPGRVTAPRAASAIAATSLALFVCVLLRRWGGTRGVQLVDDLGQLVVAMGGSVAAGWAAARSGGRLRRSWAATAIGCGSWTVSQLVWCYHELIGHRAMPSLANAGFLLFPIAMTTALWIFPSHHGRAARRRWLFDGGIVVCAVLIVSWATTLGPVARAGAQNPFVFAISLGVPVGDILILTMAVLALCRSSYNRAALAMLSIAMASMAVADSGFIYLTATGRYETGMLTDTGWLLAFLLLALAAVRSATGPPDGEAQVDPAHRSEPATMFPYAPVLVAGVVLAVGRCFGHPLDGMEFVLLSVVFVMVLVRQYTTVRENRGLLDIVEAREAALHRQAFHDQLTGLANRALFTDRVQHALDLHRRDMRPIAVLFCDLDDFKIVNDTLGHGAGDALLIRVAERLRGALRSGDTLARLGGDEFAVLLEDGSEPATVAAHLVETLREPFALADVQVALHASVGVSELRPDHPAISMDKLLTQADIAMYAAKRAGKGRLALYEPAMALPHADALRLRQPLTDAIAERAIDVAYQPIVSLSNGLVYGFEALARWTHDGRPISPARFIPIASRAGLLESLTDHMLDRACEQLAAWNARTGHHKLRVGVNVPPSLITDLTFPGRVADVLDKYGLEPGQLALEITEDALLDDLERARVVTQHLRDIGTRLSLDDFGCGYSSLVHLQQIPLNSLKIDHGFIMNVDRDANAERFTAAIISLGEDLGLDVIAEGIERPTQAEILRQFGCPLAQGYYFGRPTAASEIDPDLSGHPFIAVADAVLS